MLECWNEDPQDRPTFSQLRTKFGSLILAGKDDLYIKEGKVAAAAVPVPKQVLLALSRSRERNVSGKNSQQSRPTRTLKLLSNPLQV